MVVLEGRFNMVVGVGMMGVRGEGLGVMSKGGR